MSARMIIGSIATMCVLPTTAFAAIGIQEGYISSSSSSASVESSASSVSSELSTGALLEMQQRAARWKTRRERTQNFWADMMNSRTEASNFRKTHKERRAKRAAKRLECRDDVRKANRDTLAPITMNCYRATLTQDLEILRKQKQFVEGIVGPTENYRNPAIFHIQNLMDAISTVIRAIDAGVYSSKEGLEEAKKNLGQAYRTQYRLAMTHLRIDRSITWLQHLMVRVQDIIEREKLATQVLATLEEVIACLEDREASLGELLLLENNEALIEDFRQVQSDVKFCHDLALDAQILNTEIEQQSQADES